MGIDPGKVALFIPEGLQKFKLSLFERIGQKIGRVVRGDTAELGALPDDIVPIVGCSPEVRPLIDKWHSTGRKWIYWDRGYCRRVFATHLPRGSEIGVPMGYYRWHVRSFQLNLVRSLPDDRWKALKMEVKPWRKGGSRVVVAAPTKTYARFHKIESWLEDTIREIGMITDRQIVIRDKESKRKLQADLDDAYCLVTHGSNTAVEAVFEGVPVIVHKTSAARHVGTVGIHNLNARVFPDRDHWLRSLSYSQFTEEELVDGTLWRLLT